MALTSSCIAILTFLLLKIKGSKAGLQPRLVSPRFACVMRPRSAARLLMLKSPAHQFGGTEPCLCPYPGQPPWHGWPAVPASSWLLSLLEEQFNP